MRASRGPSRIAIALLSCLLAQASLAQDASEGESVEEEQGAPLAGPTSTEGQLQTDQSQAPSGLLRPYRDFKESLLREHGLNFGFDYTALVQRAGESLGERTAAGGVLRVFGSWGLLNRGTPNGGGLIVKFENRNRLGTDIAPQALASEVGYAGLTATVYSDAGWLLTNLFWQQALLDNRLALVAGFVDTTDYVDVYGLLSPWTDFTNQAFSNFAAIPAPNQGLGAAGRIVFKDHYYFLTGFADANGAPAEPLDAFSSLSDGELYTHAELGWAASYERQYTDNVHLTAWHVDARTEARTPGGWGLAFSASRLIADRWEPFFRLGYADGGGTTLQASVSGGLGRRVGEHDMFGVAVNWGRPSEDTLGPGLEDQYTLETYYRRRVTDYLTVSGDFQLLVDPALNPDKDVIGVFGIRARMTF